MANIFSDRTTAFDGSGSPATGTGEVTVYFSVDKAGFTTLSLWSRKDGTTDDFVVVKSISSSDVFKFDATDLDYYFTWDLTGVAGLQSQTVTATLDV